MADKALLLFTDGACRGNPGQGGAGAVLADTSGQTVAKVKKSLGHCTNNIAEYQALILGLGEALRKGCLSLAIFMDSELLVRQLQGVYRVKNPALKPLMDEIRGLLDGFDTWTVEHIPRSKNALADKLANEAIDEALKNSA